LYLWHSSSQLVNTVVVDNVVADADALGSGQALYWGAGYDIGAEELHVAICYLPMITKNYR
jgi:hypothetical protein